MLCEIPLPQRCLSFIKAEPCQRWRKRIINSIIQAELSGPANCATRYCYCFQLCSGNWPVQFKHCHPWPQGTLCHDKISVVFLLNLLLKHTNKPGWTGAARYYHFIGKVWKTPQKVFSVCGPQKRKMGTHNCLHLRDWEAEAKTTLTVPQVQAAASVLSHPSAPELYSSHSAAARLGD